MDEMRRKSDWDPKARHEGGDWQFGNDIFGPGCVGTLCVLVTVVILGIVMWVGSVRGWW